MNKTALAISTVLTVFVLAILGGIFYTLRGAAQAQAQANSQVQLQSSEIATQGLDPAAIKAINDRETAYRALIDQANARLAQAQQQEQTLQAQLNALQSGASQSAASSTAAASAITPQDAAQVAAKALNESSIYSVESAPYNGVTAYKVTFSSGDIAYVGMDGTMLTTQLASSQANAAQSASPSYGEHEHEGGEGGGE